MKKAFLLFLPFTWYIISFAQNFKQKFVATDVDNFWMAYDKIVTTSDTAQQYKYLQQLYIGKASNGLKSLMEVRRYTDKQLLNVIHAYPLFWNSIRSITYTTNELHADIETAIAQLRKLYPNLKPSTIYFSIGAFRSNGTIKGNKVLIGVEMALANQTVQIHELPDYLQTFYTSYKPLQNIVLLCTHEYVHTQQKQQVDNLLCNTLYEGVAEFVSCLATNKPSTIPSFGFARANEEKIKALYIEELFLPDCMYNWMWGENENELKERDLGYYVGYRICEEYYRRSANKEMAIKEMIELEYTDEKAVENFIDQSGFFAKPINTIYTEYENSRPTVVSISPFKNGSENVPPGKTTITIHFSQPLSTNNTGIDFGPLGEKFCPKISQEGRAFSDDGKSWTFVADLQPNKRYQILISNNFRLPNGVRLKAYLIDIKTNKK